MSQADDVRASLLASHDRDAVVRRKVAEKVHETVIDRSAPVAFAAHMGDPEAAGMLAVEQATAAAAVVLASDLRAPTDAEREQDAHPLVVMPAREVDPEVVALAEKFRAERHDPAADFDAACGSAERDEDGYYPTRIDTTAELAAAHESAKAFVSTDWAPVRRARLAEVERLLIEGMEDAGTSSLPYHRMRDALSIVRALLGGE